MGGIGVEGDRGSGRFGDRCGRDGRGKKVREESDLNFLRSYMQSGY